jgi:hypothetical protein
MASKSSDRSFDEPQHQSAQDSKFSSSDELITFAQGYFVSEFPNPERLDCPIKGTLPGLVRSGKAPDSRLRSHMFGCSECFGEYQNALTVYRAETTTAEIDAQLDSWWTKFLQTLAPKPVRVFAGALSLSLLIVVVGYVWRENRTRRQQTVAKRDSASVRAPSEDPSTKDLPPANIGKVSSPEVPSQRINPRAFPKQANQQKVAVQRPKVRPSEESELIAMSINLEDHRVTRDGWRGGGSDAASLYTLSEGSGGEIKFSRARIRLLISLPEGSRKGFYTVSIVGASGDTMDTINGRSNDGKTLTVTLNLQGLAPRKYELRISSEGEPPIGVPIVVTDPPVIAGDKIPPRKGPIRGRPAKKP